MNRGKREEDDSQGLYYFCVPKDLLLDRSHGLQFWELMLFGRILYFTIQGDHNKCLESNSQLATMFLKHKDTVRRSLAKLEEKEFIYREYWNGYRRMYADFKYQILAQEENLFG